MKTPYLMQFAVQCVSPGRDSKNKMYFYDEETELVRWLGDEMRTAAIELEGEEGPKTKKCDIEKSDDNKDRRMWL